MARRHGAQLDDRLRQRNVEAALAVPRPFEQELQRQRRLASARRTFEEMETAARQPAAENVIEFRNVGLDGVCSNGLLDYDDIPLPWMGTILTAREAAKAIGTVGKKGSDLRATYTRSGEQPTSGRVPAENVRVGRRRRAATKG
jgi:hypothetical protein